MGRFQTKKYEEEKLRKCHFVDNIKGVKKLIGNFYLEARDF